MADISMQDMFDDMKQFIAVTVSQQTSEIVKILDRFETRLDGVESVLEGVNTRSKRVENKIDDLSASVAEALDTSNEAVESHLNDYGHRITLLENAA